MSIARRHTGMRRMLSAIAAFLISGAGQSQTWRSTLYPENWQRPGNSTSFYNDKLIQDFSYAGYKRGEEPVPNVVGPVFNVVTGYGADPTGASDSTVAIQNAINAAATAGGGVVYLPAGEFRVSPQGTNTFCLRISTSNIVLRGAGTANTFLLNTSYTMNSKAVIQISPTSAPTGTARNITADLPGPTRRIPVENAASFSPGNIVRLQWNFTDEWVNENNQQTWWGTSRPGSSTYLREVTATSPAEGWIEIDVPTRYTMKTRDSANVRTISSLLTNVGIESLAIGNLQHPGTGWGEEDYTDPTKAAYDTHGSWLIRVQNVRDSWITSVHSRQATANTSTCHMLSNGISLLSSMRITLQNCQMRRSQYGGGGGNGYMYRVQSSNECLVRNSIADFSRHGFVISHGGTSGNVFFQCEDRETQRSTGSSSAGYTTGGSGSDNHMFFSHSNLWDQCHAHNSFWTAHHRTFSGTTPHGVTSAHAVYWNTTGSGTRYANASNPIVRSEQLHYGYVIGTRATSGTAFHASNPTGGNTAPADHLEGIGSAATLFPQSLYLDQLSRRLAPTMTYRDNGATSGTAPVDANSPYAPGATVTVLGLGSLTKTGFIFTGWNTAPDGSGASYAAGSTFQITGSTFLYAQWTGLPYTVTFNANGGSSADPLSMQVTFGTTYGTLPATSRAGHNFAGWFTAATGGDLVTDGTSVSIASDHTLHARWTMILTASSSVRHFIRGESEDQTATIGYITSTTDVVGTSGATGVRDDRNVVFGFPLPILPAGATLDAATFNFEITQARDSTGGANLPELHAYLLNTANPVGSGLNSYYHGPLDPNTNVKRIGTTSVSISVTSDVNYTAGQQARSFSLPDDALNLLKSFYNGNTPNRSVAYFRFNLGVDPLVTTFRRYRVSTAANLSSLELQYTAPPNSAPAWTANPLTKPNATMGAAYSASLALDASDANNDALSFAKISGPDWLSVSPNGTLSGTPPSVGDSPNVFIVSVSDNSAAPVEAELRITVDSRPPTTPTIQEWPTAALIKVGQALSSANLSGGSASVPGTFAYNNPSITPAAGTYTAAVTFTPDDTTGYLTVDGTVDVTVLTAFELWAGGAEVTFKGDANGDGVADGLGWLLGAANPAENASALLPSAVDSNGALEASFTMLHQANRGGAVLKLQYSTNLGTWTAVTVPEESGTHDGVDFVITPNGEVNEVKATVPANATGPGGRVFMRLSGELPGTANRSSAKMADLIQIQSGGNL